MNGTPSLWVDEAPTVTRADNLFHVTFKSGDAEFRMILAPKLLGMLGHRATAELVAFQQRNAEIIPFRTEFVQGTRGRLGK